MKTILKFIIPVFIITFIVYSCNEDSDLDGNSITDDKITTIFERTSESLVTSNNGIFPDVNKIELIGKNTELGKNLITEINQVKQYDLNLSKIKRITFSSAKYYAYSIPINLDERELVIVNNNNSISIVISKQISLVNGNKKFIISNFKNEPIMSLEQNTENMFGNRILFKNSTTSFEVSSSLPVIENPYQTLDSGCPGLNSFSACMQCMWDECSSSWVCGAILALEPGPTIAFAAGLCALDTIANM